VGGMPAYNRDFIYRARGNISMHSDDCRTYVRRGNRGQVLSRGSARDHSRICHGVNISAPWTAHVGAMYTNHLPVRNDWMEAPRPLSCQKQLPSGRFTGQQGGPWARDYLGASETAETISPDGNFCAGEPVNAILGDAGFKGPNRGYYPVRVGALIQIGAHSRGGTQWHPVLAPATVRPAFDRRRARRHAGVEPHPA